MSKIYCYSFFIHSMQPLGYYLARFIHFGHHKQTFSPGGKSLFSPRRITGRKLEQFHVSVSIAAASKVTFELTYEELLKRQLGKFELLIKVRPKQLVKHFQVSCPSEGWREQRGGFGARLCSLWHADADFFSAQIDVHIFEPQGIRFLETDSTFMTNELTEALTKVQNETKVKQQLPDVTASGSFKLCCFKSSLLIALQAHILFKPTVDQQKINPELDETLLNGDFVVRYDVKRGATAGDIQVKKK